MNLTQRQMQITEHVRQVRAGLALKRAIPWVMEPFSSPCPVCDYNYGQCESLDWMAEAWGDTEAYKFSVEAWNEGKPYLVSCVWCGAWLTVDEDKKTLEATSWKGSSWIQWKTLSNLCYEPKPEEVRLPRRQAPEKTSSLKKKAIRPEDTLNQIKWIQENTEPYFARVDRLNSLLQDQWAFGRDYSDEVFKTEIHAPLKKIYPELVDWEVLAQIPKKRL